MTLYTFLDYFGTMFFAISGVLSASDKKLDVFGASIIGLVTAVGGGTTRDLLIGDRPVGWLKEPNYLYTVLLGISIAFVFKRYLAGLRRTFFIFDTLGIGIFTIIGLEKALSFGIAPPLAILMGVSTAVVGGVLRDTLINEVPLIFRQELYATACIIGAAIYLLLHYFTSLPHNMVMFATMGTIIIIRTLAIRLNIQLPRFQMRGE